MQSQEQDLGIIGCDPKAKQNKTKMKVMSLKSSQSQIFLQQHSYWGPKVLVSNRVSAENQEPHAFSVQVQTLLTIFAGGKTTIVNEVLLTRTVRYQPANDHSGLSRDASLQLGLQWCTHRKGLQL